MRDRRAAELRELEIALHWADLHANDPRDDGQPAPPGAARLVRLGGIGTPKVQDLSICELAIARGQHTLTARALMADGLDLRHRLPEVYAAVREGRCDLWVARRVASMTRNLDPEAVALVDRAVAESGRPGGREAAGDHRGEGDGGRHRTRSGRAGGRQHRRYVAVTPTDEFGLRTVIAPGGAGRRRLAGRDRRQGRRRPRRAPRAGARPRRAAPVTSFARSRWAGWPTPRTSQPCSPARPSRAAAAPRPGTRCVHVHLHQAALEGARRRSLGSRRSARCSSTSSRSCSATPASPWPRSSTWPPASRSTATNTPSRSRTAPACAPWATSSPTPGRSTARPTWTTPTPTRHGPPGQTGDHNAAQLGRQHHPRQDPPRLPKQTARSPRATSGAAPRPPTPRRRHRHPRARHRPSPRARTPRSTRRRPRADRSQPADRVTAHPETFGSSSFVPHGLP